MKLLALVALATLPLTACATGRPSVARPTVTVTAPAPAPSSSPTVDFDRTDKNIACFALGTYQGAKRAGDSKTDDYAVDAQDYAGEVKDPRWSVLSDLPADEAMRRLAALCKEIHYGR